MRENRRDVKVEPPRKMATRSQTKAVAKDQKSQLSGTALDDLRSIAGSRAQDRSSLLKRPMKTIDRTIERPSALDRTHACTRAHTGALC